ncbi:hypothetical protein [Kribbella sp.]|uniref:hypothetical protein n=1 Tax=Kribbella sp. TaxID=1871183 RepID=UPI002D2DC09B|nr:hypothetical protein [Kribbella sp.]HZX08295.1 hypothetical protein [Kribbella sp.]
MADRFDLDAIEADDALLDLLAAGGESARAAGEHDPAVALLADLRLAVEVEDELPVETIDDPESFLARCAALNPITDPFARKVATRGLAFGVAAVAALSVSGVAAAVTGDPLSPYEKVIEKMVDAVRPQTSFPKQDLNGLPVVDRQKIVKVGKDYQAKASAEHADSNGTGNSGTDAPQAQDNTNTPPLISPPVGDKALVLPLQTEQKPQALATDGGGLKTTPDPSGTKTTTPSDGKTNEPGGTSTDQPTGGPTDPPSTPPDTTGTATPPPTDTTTTPPATVDNGSGGNGSSGSSTDPTTAPTTAPTGDTGTGTTDGTGTGQPATGGTGTTDGAGTGTGTTGGTGTGTTDGTGSGTTGGTGSTGTGSTGTGTTGGTGSTGTGTTGGTGTGGTDTTPSGTTTTPGAGATVVPGVIDGLLNSALGAVPVDVPPTPTGELPTLDSAQQYFGPADATAQSVTEPAMAKVPAKAHAKTKAKGKPAGTESAKHSSGKVSTGSVRKAYTKGKHSTGHYAEGKHAAIARTHGSTDESSLLQILGIINVPTETQK